MPRIGIRITEDFHDEIKELAAVEGVSVSDFVRQSIENEMHHSRTASDTVSPDSLLILKSQMEPLMGQLQTKDDQIKALSRSLDQAQQLQAIQAKTNAQLTEQLDSSRQLIEEKLSRSLWQRLKATFVAAPG